MTYCTCDDRGMTKKITEKKQQTDNFYVILIFFICTLYICIAYVNTCE